MHARAVIFEQPGKLSIDQVELVDPGDDDLVVDVDWSGISTGTEKLLWTGDMPPFPGLKYPLVPGYETVGRVGDAAPTYQNRIGDRGYVPGSAGYKDVRGLFGGSASKIVVKADKARTIDPGLGKNAILLALAATAHHALAAKDAALPELIIGHGVLGRLLARITLALGGPAPVVWDIDAARRDGARGYDVRDPSDDAGRTYNTIYDVSGASGILDQLIQHVSPAGEIVLAGFYSGRVDFAFPPAFMKEARMRVAAEWKPADMEAVLALLAQGRLSLSDLVTHEAECTDAARAYDQAFNDPTCLKMVLNWSAEA
ncbi:MAG: chlorophyll synthesis pathway protein BchC [Sphingomonadales bacterium]